MKALQYVEIDVPSFVITSPETTETFRFAVDTNYLPNSIPAIPSLLSVNVSPTTISLGTNLGQRATVTCSFKDHRHIFGTEAYDAGTFWGKFRARYGLTLRGSPLRLINGTLGQTLAQMDKRYFAIESTEGPNPQSSEFQIIAKDILKLADNDRAQAPILSNGYLTSAINDGTVSPPDTTITLSPSGIGSEYPASGYVAVGGKEIIEFTRSGDVLTLTTRGALGTSPQSHAANDRVQIVLRFVGETPAGIISSILQNYSGVSGTYISSSDWAAEMAAFMPNVYTGIIAEPTGVNKLISEVIEQAGLAVWWDDTVQKVQLRVLRAIPTTASLFTEDNTLEGSLQVKEQPESRLSQVWTYFGQRDPLKPVDDTDNYRASEKTIDETAEAEYDGAVIKKIYARWIPAFGRTVAIRANNIHLGRFRDPPRRFNFSVWRRGADPIGLGEGYRIKSWMLQDIDGTEVNTPVQVTRLNAMDDRIDVEAEEMLFTQFLTPGELFERAITIDSNVNNINLRDIHDSIYPEPTGTESPAVTVTFTVSTGVIVGSANTGNPAIDVGSWPTGVTVILVNNGRIQGAGGSGGTGHLGVTPGDSGGEGGVALYTRENITVDNNSAIWGGGGGGGGGGSSGAITGGTGGGGGAGTIGGFGGTGFSGGSTNGFAGSGTAGGNAGNGGVSGGNGGDPGQNGASGTNGTGGNGGSGGAAGAAVDGHSFVTYDTSGDIQGGTIN